MNAWLDDGDVQLYHGDVLEELRQMPSEHVQCIVTSPPYLDARPEYPSPTIEEFEEIFAELYRVCTGPALVNVGRLFRGGAESLWWVSLIHAAAPNWRLLDTIVWIKPNANPIHGNVFANRHEYVLVLGDPGTTLNVDAVRVPYAPESIARLRRGWTNHVGVKGDVERRRLTTEPNADGARAPSYVVIDVGREKGNEHPAPMPVDLALELVSVASWPGQIVLDPFMGSGTTGVAARRLGRHCIGIDRDADYLAIAAKRLQQLSLLGDAS